jgi:hypothetical protein
MSAPREVKTRRAVYAQVRGDRHPDVQLRVRCKEAEA